MAAKYPSGAYSGAIPVREAAIPGAGFYVFILSAAAGIYIWEAWYLYLDDAFIHLRIAQNLRELGFYSFNGDVRTYCTSSPLFTALLALCLHIITSPSLPKVLGVLIYLVLFAMIGSRISTAVTPRARWLSLAFLAAVGSPLAMRWLADGMETGLIGIFALLLARAAIQIYTESPAATPFALLGYAVMGLLATTLRIEFSLLIALIGAAASTRVGRRGIDTRAIALAAGSATGLGLIYWIFGRIVPDTAIAKAHALANLSTGMAALATLMDIGKAHAAASSLGVIVVLGMIGSFLLMIRSARDRLFVAVLNGGYALLIFIVVWRQQAIQGYRYFVFMEFFLFAFNIAVLNRSNGDRDQSRTAIPQRSRVASVLGTIMLGAAFVGWQAFDLYKLRTITAGRAISFQKFKNVDLRDIRGTYGIAWDVGMIGYFSQATILDPNGLVDGIDVARMMRADRLRLFVGAHPVRFVFADSLQLEALKNFIDVDRWTIRETFDFPNFSGDPDRHFLLVRQN